MKVGIGRSPLERGSQGVQRASSADKLSSTRGSRVHGVALMRDLLLVVSLLNTHVDAVNIQRVAAPSDQGQTCYHE